MNREQIKEVLNAVESYLVSMPAGYSVVSHGDNSQKEYRHGRIRKVWNISIKLARPSRVDNQQKHSMVSCASSRLRPNGSGRCPPVRGVVCHDGVTSYSSND